MATKSTKAAELLARATESGRIHSGYLVSGTGDLPRESALRFARSLVCVGGPPKPCEDCSGCRRSQEHDEAIAIDGTGKRGPLYRHVGDHPDLFWTERDPGSTRVRIAQVRALQGALRLGANEGGWRAAVIADAELLNAEAQNALLRLLEEPPDRTCIVLVSARASGLLATIRSRCQRVRFVDDIRSTLRDDDQPPEQRELVRRFDEMRGAKLTELMDWAEEYRGNRGAAAEQVQQLLETGSSWLRERVDEAAARGETYLRGELDAFTILSRCRRDLIQRNANPQMIAERALVAVRRVAGS